MNNTVKKLPLEDEWNNFAHMNMKPITLEQHLGKKIKVEIDRPMGSKNSEHSFTYPVNCGYAYGIIGAKNEELDAYLLGVYEPVDKYEGRLIGIIHRSRNCNFEDVEKVQDVEEVLVVAPKTYTTEQIEALVEFQERWFASRVVKVYDKPYYWPESFTIDMPEVQKSIKAVIKDGEFSLTKIAPILKRGYGRCTAFGFWLADNGIIEKLSKTKLKKIETTKSKIKVKTYEEAIEKIRVQK